jgi:hypothetical protein
MIYGDIQTMAESKTQFDENQFSALTILPIIETVDLFHYTK